MVRLRGCNYTTFNFTNHATDYEERRFHRTTRSVTRSRDSRVSYVTGAAPSSVWKNMFNSL